MLSAAVLAVISHLAKINLALCKTPEVIRSIFIVKKLRKAGN
jgi:hypothetical protein